MSVPKSCARRQRHRAAGREAHCRGPHEYQPELQSRRHRSTCCRSCARARQQGPRRARHRRSCNRQLPFMFGDGAGRRRASSTICSSIPATTSISTARPTCALGTVDYADRPACQCDWCAMAARCSSASASSAMRSCTACSCATSRTPPGAACSRMAQGIARSGADDRDDRRHRAVSRRACTVAARCSWTGFSISIARGFSSAASIRTCWCSGSSTKAASARSVTAATLAALLERGRTGTALGGGIRGTSDIGVLHSECRFERGRIRTAGRALAGGGSRRRRKRAPQTRQRWSRRASGSRTACSCTRFLPRSRRAFTQRCARCRKRAPPVPHDGRRLHQSALRR